MGMAIASMVIEFEYEEEYIGTVEIEKRMYNLLAQYSERLPIDIKHLEASPGTLYQAFGVKGIDK